MWLRGHQVSIFKQTLIKSTSDNLADIRMHPVLYLQHVYWVLRTHESFEETLVVVAFEADGAEDCCWKLLGVPDENQPFAGIHKRD